jgi:cobalt-zinc-cadmium efflux system membrane fusion protein
MVEIVSGLAAGERFAEDGSFLVKAELGKGASGHDH